MTCSKPRGVPAPSNGARGYLFCIPPRILPRIRCRSTSRPRTSRPSAVSSTTTASLMSDPSRRPDHTPRPFGSIRSWPTAPIATAYPVSFVFRASSTNLTLACFIRSLVRSIYCIQRCLVRQNRSTYLLVPAITKKTLRYCSSSSSKK